MRPHPVDRMHLLRLLSRNLLRVLLHRLRSAQAFFAVADLAVVIETPTAPSPTRSAPSTTAARIAAEHGPSGPAFFGMSRTR
jgi:hypothetical protein